MRAGICFGLCAALAGCYFETPTTRLELDGAASPVDPAEAGDDPPANPQDEGGAAGPGEPENEAGQVEPRDGGPAAPFDGGGPGAPIDAGGLDAGPSDSGADTGPICACDGGKCLPGTAQCVECLADNDCSNPTRAKCDQTSHSCVPCDAKAQCGTRFPGRSVCAAGACVQCSAADPAACTGTATPVCASTGNMCVGCNVNADCKDANRAACEANVCRACRTDQECAGKTSGGVTLDACYNGQCVDCRISTTDTRMDVGCTGNNACNPATRTCTNRPKNAVTVCGSCLADSECQTNYRCIALQYDGAARGSYCLKRETATCEGRFRVVLPGRRSVSGAAAETYCGISEQLTTCEAVARFGAECPTRRDAECGSEGAVCRDFAGWACSYPCDSTVQCQQGNMCPDTGADKYCRP